MSNNSTYEARIEDRKYEIARVWTECLRDRAGFPPELEAPIKRQARGENLWKPIGAFFARLDWIEKQQENYRQRLEQGEVTMQGTLIESFHFYFREDSRIGDGACSPVPRDLTIQAAENALKASELTPIPEKYNFTSVEEWVSYVVNKQ